MQWSTVAKAKQKCGQFQLKCQSWNEKLSFKQTVSFERTLEIINTYLLITFYNFSISNTFALEILILVLCNADLNDVQNAGCTVHRIGMYIFTF